MSMGRASFVSAGLAIAVLSYHAANMGLVRVNMLDCGGNGMAVWWGTPASPAIVECQKEERLGQILLPQEKIGEVNTANGQFLELYKHHMLGSIFMIDGTVQVVEFDEDAYHEMMVHVPFAHFGPVSTVLIVGGGDGGAMKRVLEYDTVTHVDLVDIDLHAVRNFTEAHFSFASAFVDPRVHLHNSCADRFISEASGAAFQYDIALVDGTDCETAMDVPTGGVTEDVLGGCDGASGPLFLTSFYKKIKARLSPSGILVRNLDSPSWDADTVSTIVIQLRKLWKHVFLCHFHVPTFLSGHYSVAVATDAPLHKLSPSEIKAWAAKNIATTYYTPAIHDACYALPKRVEDLIGPQN
ncbi:Polyamine aminopropyltransferase 1 [Diplonema papillatum]|nr:Polyamine aminopropyltransferase 1 [Diplonema papillatum]